MVWRRGYANIQNKARGKVGAFTIMKRLALFALLLAMVYSVAGCQVIPTDMFPKFRWYWSKDAEQFRQDRDHGNPHKHQ